MIKDISRSHYSVCNNDNKRCTKDKHRLMGLHEPKCVDNKLSREPSKIEYLKIRMTTETVKTPSRDVTLLIKSLKHGRERSRRSWFVFFWCLLFMFIVFYANPDSLVERGPSKHGVILDWSCCGDQQVGAHQKMTINDLGMIIWPWKSASLDW